MFSQSGSLDTATLNFSFFLSSELGEIPTLKTLQVFGIVPDGTLQLLREALPHLQINCSHFTTIARPTIGNKKNQEIWGIKCRLTLQKPSCLWSIYCRIQYLLWNRENRKDAQSQGHSASFSLSFPFASFCKYISDLRGKWEVLLSWKDYRSFC